MSAPTLPANPPQQSNPDTRADKYTVAIAVGNVVLAQSLRDMEKDDTRKRKMSAAIDRKMELIRQSFPSEIESSAGLRELSKVIASCVEEEQRVSYVIDLAFSSPFAPYDLKLNDKAFGSCLKELGVVLGLRMAKVEQILKTKREAEKSHKNINWGQISLYGAAGVVAFAVGGWALAPVLAGALGSAAGLSGAAATAHGLALLGGGSLALGGAGMAGGMWVVTATGATLGLLGAGGYQAMWQLGAAQATLELTKLQVSFKEVYLANRIELAKCKEVFQSLDVQREAIVQKLEEERQLNENNSKRIDELEKTMKAIEDAADWMRKEQGQCAV